MQPLMSRSHGSYNNITRRKPPKYWKSKIVGAILVTILLAIATIAITKFVAFSSAHLDTQKSSNRAHSFLEKPDNSAAYPSDIQWEDPKRKLPPKGSKPPLPGIPAAAAGESEQDDDIADGSDGSGTYQWGSSSGSNFEDPNAWRAAPEGLDGTDVNGVIYGGDDVTTIEEPQEAEEEIEIPEEADSPLHIPRNDPVYPTSVEVKRTKIVASDPDHASSYYKENGVDDMMTSMPYLVTETCANSPSNCGFKQYSGYLLANNNAEIHYWFIEAEEDPLDKPVFFWTNGGPGCSGLDGLLTEHGPWKVTDSLKIHYNPYAWNTEVNMVYLEQPFGVGFSAADAEEDEVVGDQNAADDMDAAIRNWLNKFPLYKNNKIYLSSESWGGHYVPITAYTILQNNDDGASPEINFGGFFLGNPYTDFYENAYGFVGGVYGHGLMKGADWDLWRDNCWGNEEALDTDATCSAIYSRAYISAYNSNLYALDYPTCYDDEDWSMDLMNRPAPEFWRFYNYKDAHIHHAARGFMEAVLSHHDYNSLKMEMDRSELQLLHDRIVQQLELEEDDFYSNYPPQQVSNMPQEPQQGSMPQKPGMEKPEDGQQAGQQAGQQGGIQEPQEPQQGSIPQKPGMQKPEGGQQSGIRVASGAQQQHDRPNHNIGHRIGGSAAERDEARAREEEETEDEDPNVQEYAAADGYLPCIDYDMADYLNLGTVQAALHVKPTEWQMCSNSVWNKWPEDDYDTKVEAYYAEIIEKYLMSKELTLTVYSGDDDSVCGLQGTQYWLDRWRYKVNENTDWNPWQDDDTQLGGFYSQYMTLDGSNVALHFLTVRTAGHMVPTTEPARALMILKKFLYEFNNKA